MLTQATEQTERAGPITTGWLPVTEHTGPKEWAGLTEMGRLPVTKHTLCFTSSGPHLVPYNYILFNKGSPSNTQHNYFIFYDFMRLFRQEGFTNLKQYFRSQFQFSVSKRELCIWPIDLSLPVGLHFRTQEDMEKQVWALALTKTPAQKSPYSPPVLDSPCQAGSPTSLAARCGLWLYSGCRTWRGVTLCH